MNEKRVDCTDCEFLATWFGYGCVATPVERPRPRDYEWCLKGHKDSHPFCPDYKKKEGVGYE